MSSFTNFLRVLGKGKSETVLDIKFAEDFESFYNELTMFDCPSTYPTSIIQTDWYKSGGWKAVWRTAHTAWDITSDVPLAEYDEWIKQKWPRPVEEG